MSIMLRNFLVSSEVLAEVRENPETCVVVYQDEFSFYLQPTVAKDWTKTGTKYPLRVAITPKKRVMGSVP